MNNNTKKYKCFKKDEHGISVLMSIIILSSLMIMTITISDIVLRVGRGSRQIGYSEIAYYAAETAVERGLYEIEKNRETTNLNSLNQTWEEDLEDSGGSWTRGVSLITNLTTECGSIVGQEGICVDVAGDITVSNPLKVQLDSGSSFQLDLNFLGMDFPNDFSIDWTGTARVVVLDNNTDTQTTEQVSPVTLDNLDTNLYLIRIINDNASQTTFTLLPAGDELPIGILMTGTGIYQDEQRVLEIERTNWQIY